ncbi:hypothetical protein HK100_004975 [Physocladia obscura]|uniref:Uncharacterized protein n=1 Tax=Physocladia obscura TaxID=109957 RepID=A0AAD5SUH2_9FUNG|nr:hypothetical protein HK100_004975 [Physocladia obscura]
MCVSQYSAPVTVLSTALILPAVVSTIALATATVAETTAITLADTLTITVDVTHDSPTPAAQLVLDIGAQPSTTDTPAPAPQIQLVVVHSEVEYIAQLKSCFNPTGKDAQDAVSVHILE